MSLSPAHLVLVLTLFVLGCGPGQKARGEPAMATTVPTASQQCVSCHAARGVTGSAIRDWRKSRHAVLGVACATCHLTSDAGGTACEDRRVRRAVSSKLCGGCHPKQGEQFSKGKHALAWTAMNAMPTTAEQPSVIVAGEKGCGGCHRIGRDDGKCDSCHTRHLFAAAEARRPEACQTCHMGFDHPQWEMYATSKHGSIYAVEKDTWDFSLPLSQWGQGDAMTASAGVPRAPTCAMCHMPEGQHRVRTAWGFLGLRLPEKDDAWMKDRVRILQGLGVLDEAGKPLGRLDVVKTGQIARLAEDEWVADRHTMVQVCSRCHAPTFSKEQLALGDQALREADRLMAEAIGIVDGLYKDGLLRPKRTPALAHPDLLRFYEVEHPIEQKLFVMFLEHRARTFQGAFHQNPDYQHWYGWAEMKRDLAEIRHEASEIRRAQGASPSRTAPPAVPSSSRP